MDFDVLVQEIASRVMQKLNDTTCEINTKVSPGILELRQCQSSDCDLSPYQAIVVYQLTNDALGKIGAGISDTPYLQVLSKAILMGKKIYVPKEEIELFQYKQTAPAPYYQMMLEKLNLLQASGVVFCNINEVENCITNTSITTPIADSIVSPTICKSRIEKEIQIVKRVITEQDMIHAHADDVTSIIIGKRTILSDLAKEYAHNRNISIRKGDSL